MLFTGLAIWPLFAAELPDANVLLEHSMDELKLHQTYQMESETTVSNSRSGGPPARRSFSIFRSGPDRLRVESDTMTLVADGQYTWIFTPFQRQYSKRAAISNAETTLANLNQLFGIVDSDIHVPTANAETLHAETVDIEGEAFDCWVVGMKTGVSGAESTRVSGSTPSQITTVVWIEKTTGLERQRLTKWIRHDGASEVVSESRTIYHSMRFDEPLPESLFQFTPPAGAKEVASVLAPAFSPNLSGKTAPIFSVKSIDGKSYNLSELKNKVVFLDFWTSWCEPCRKEVPSISKLQRDLKDQDLVVLGVNVGEDRQTVEKFLKTVTISYPIVLTAGTDIVSDYHINAYPTYVVIGKDGLVVGEQVGGQGEQSLRRLVRESVTPSLMLTQNTGTAIAQDTPDPKQTIRAWIIGSPHTGATPPPSLPESMDREAAKAGLTIEVQSLPAGGFSERFFAAVNSHEEPELLITDNFGNIQGITTALGHFEGIASREDIRRTLIQVSSDTFQNNKFFFFLVGSADHFEAARSMILGQPSCKPEWAGLKPLEDDLNKTALAALQAYLMNGATQIDDLDRLRIASPGINTSAGQTSRSGLQIHGSQACGYWGNEHLAFVPLVTTFENDQPWAIRGSREPGLRKMGRQAILLIFRAAQGQWKVLGAATDPLSTGDFLSGIPKLQDLLSGARASSGIPAPATLLSPVDGDFPAPPSGGRFGEFIWRPSLSNGVIAEIIEFAYDDNARYFLRFRTKDNRDEGRISAGQLWTTLSEWRWRVWTISSSGAISFSLSHTFKN
jgi:thiol-disulfide isomerase/thioredoxin